MIILTNAIRSLYPDAEFVIEDEDYNKIRWIKNKPENFASRKELEAEAERLKHVERSLEYQAKRRLEYPPMSEYLDAVYWQNRGDDSKMTAYLEAVEAVKLKYPKEPI